MIKKAVQEAFNEQIKNEIYSAYLYLSMNAHFTSANLNGFANWMRVQSGEEWLHAMSCTIFLLDRGGKAILQAIPQPPTDFKSPLEIMQQVYEHEQHVTASILQLYEVATREADYPAQVMLHWFINEQVEGKRRMPVRSSSGSKFSATTRRRCLRSIKIKTRVAAPGGCRKQPHNKSRDDPLGRLFFPHPDPLSGDGPPRLT